MHFQVGSRLLAAYRAQNNLPASVGPLMCFIGSGGILAPKGPKLERSMKRLKNIKPGGHRTALSLKALEPQPYS